ncbi:MAG TPA: EAL domain-containing protein [Gemmatimonadaceae bacterium]|nr:EAL domain-containing protein [Gemmatimonadaceae bacterium]
MQRESTEVAPPEPSRNATPRRIGGSPAIVLPGLLPRAFGRAPSLLAVVLVLAAAAVGYVAFDPSSEADVAILFATITLLVLLLVRALVRIRADVLALARSEASYRALVQHSTDGIFVLDRNLTIRYASPAVERLLSTRLEDVVDSSFLAWVHPEDTALVQRFVQTALDESAPVQDEWRMLDADRSVVWTENTGIDLLHERNVAGIVINTRDISERRDLQNRLTHKAFHDELTNLANRALFLNRVEHAVARAPRAKHPAAVLFLDLDDFKKVNDSLGHAVGDQLLVAAANRLGSCVRPGDTIARLGGDEFAVLLEDVSDMSDVVAVAERIGEAMRAPFTVGTREVFVGVSIGIATVSMGESPDEILRNADLAMYFAKARHKGHYAIYAREMHAHVMDRLELEAELRAAVEQGGFEVEYQPIVNLASGEVCGAEALLRWQHPSRGTIRPGRFMALAEETGLIVPIGREVLRRACERAREWRTLHRGRQGFHMSVNLSGRHFQDPVLLDDVRGALRDSGLDPWALTLEITESVLMRRSEETLEILRALKGLGVNLAIDDFGTGYSSLGYLQEFPIDVLKIDRSFVESVGNEDEDPVLARAIIALAKTLRIETVAEGIERQAQSERLRAMGCTLGQGYLFAPPMPAVVFEKTILAGSNDLVAPEVALAARRSARRISG